MTQTGKIGRYEIRSKLGAGGMGEIYLAHDTQLDRAVALKTLPSDLAMDQQRMNRLVREAKAASGLNHPNIVTIHEIGESDGVNFLVIEYVDGETLRDRMNRGPLPVSDALEIATQIASALTAAHEAGIVHRDIKPENIMLRRRDGLVKLLDFGIAKLEEPQSVVDTEAATRFLVNTAPGMVMGTVGYMSPEQARGLAVDARTDIWSLGVVLYEMITGHPPFQAETGTDVLVAILKEEPAPLSDLFESSQTLQWILGKALRKERDERYQTAKELLTDLKELKHQLDLKSKFDNTRSAAAVGTTQESPAANSSRTLWSLVAVIVFVLLMAGVFYWWRTKQSRSTDTAAVPKLSQLTFTDGIEEYPAWSPDGKQIAYSGEVGGVRKIFIKEVDSGSEVQLTKGPNDDIQPAWTPDYRAIVFVRSKQPNQKLEPGDVFGAFERGDVWKIEISSGEETRLLENAFNPSFSPDGKTITFDAAWVGPHRIWTSDSQGHNPQQISSDTSEEVNHVRPRWSPDGSRIVFQNIERTRFNIRAIDMAQRKMSWVTNDLFNNLNPVWSHSGKAVYFSSDRGGGYNVWRIDLRDDGSISGAPRQLTTGAGTDVELAMSPDGTRLAVAILKQNADLWRLAVDPDTGTPTGKPQEVITTTREDSRGSWSPDGGSIAFNSDRSGEMNLWLYSLSDRNTRQLTKGAGGDFQPRWSPDGKTLVFFSSRSGNADIWTLNLETGSMVQLTSTSSIDINPFFSPDGKVLAYQSDQTGRPEIWVMNADGSNARQLTNVGVRGHFICWDSDGSAVIFLSPYGEHPRVLRAPLTGEEPTEIRKVNGGAHMSFSPRRDRIMDVVGHKTLWVSPVSASEAQKIFEFEDKDVRIDYPVWSPDGKWVLFDRFRPQGGDIWMIESFE